MNIRTSTNTITSSGTGKTLANPGFVSKYFEYHVSGKKLSSGDDNNIRKADGRTDFTRSNCTAELSENGVVISQLLNTKFLSVLADDGSGNSIEVLSINNVTCDPTTGVIKGDVVLAAGYTFQAAYIALGE